MVIAKHFPLVEVAKKVGVTKEKMRTIGVKYGVKWESRYFKHILRVMHSRSKDEELVRWLWEDMKNGTSFETIVKKYMNRNQNQKREIRSQSGSKRRKNEAFVDSLFA